MESKGKFCRHPDKDTVEMAIRIQGNYSPVFVGCGILADDGARPEAI
jgi:hypothetical protein